MARPRTLTDEQRKASNAKRQAKWRAKHEGFARLKERNAKRAKRETEGVGVEPSKVSPKKVTGDMPHYGDVHYESDDAEYEREANKNRRPAGEIHNQLPSQGIEIDWPEE